MNASGGYEAALWRQVGQTPFALDVLDRKPQEGRRRFHVAIRQELRARDRAVPECASIRKWGDSMAGPACGAPKGGCAAQG